MMNAKHLVIGFSLLLFGCGTKSEKIIFSSYESGVLSATNGQTFVCYSSSQLRDVLRGFPLRQDLVQKLEEQDFGSVFVCGIANHKVREVVGKDAMGFIRVVPVATNGLGVAIVKRHPNRFYQFNMREQ